MGICGSCIGNSNKDALCGHDIITPSSNSTTISSEREEAFIRDMTSKYQIYMSPQPSRVSDDNQIDSPKNISQIVSQNLQVNSQNHYNINKKDRDQDKYDRYLDNKYNKTNIYDNKKLTSDNYDRGVDENPLTGAGDSNLGVESEEESIIPDECNIIHRYKEKDPNNQTITVKINGGHEIHLKLIPKIEKLKLNPNITFSNCGPCGDPIFHLLNNHNFHICRKSDKTYSYYTLRDQLTFLKSGQSKNTRRSRSKPHRGGVVVKSLGKTNNRDNINKRKAGKGCERSGIMMLNDNGGDHQPDIHGEGTIFSDSTRNKIRGADNYGDWSSDNDSDISHDSDGDCDNRYNKTQFQDINDN